MADDALLRKARQVAQAARERGGRALLVGGYVRDELLGMQPKDGDVEVYGLEAPDLREMLRRFGKVDCVGESFRVYKVAWHEGGERLELDVSLPRRDRKTGEGHKGFEVEGDPFASVEDAARRRDFTVNAMMRDPLTNELLDPFGGQQDLEDRVLRAVDPQHFGEDSLRVLRAMQFAARFYMTIDPATVELCRSIDLSDLPKERIWGEWEKLLLKAAKPGIGLKAARELGILEQLLPMFRLRPRSTAFDTLCDTVDRAVLERVDLSDEESLALLLSKIGLCPYWSGFRNLSSVEEMLDVFGIQTVRGYKLREQVLKLVGNSGMPYYFWAVEQRAQSKPQDYIEGRATDGDFRRLACRCDPHLLYHLTHSTSNQRSVKAAEWFKAKMQSLGVWDGPPTPLLMGRHLLEMGLKPGPRIGDITRAVYEKQLDGDITTLEEAQSAARRLMEEN